MLQLVESTDAGPVDTEDRLCTSVTYTVWLFPGL